MRVAAIDIGTNSVLLLVAEARAPEAGGAGLPGADELVAIADRATVTRLGEGVDRSRALAPEAVERTLACLEQYADEARALGAERIDAVGTSAMRDAAGGEAFRGRARAVLGVEPRVISGDEEARLTFEGALLGLTLDGPAAVFDVGGGSTEIITAGGARAVSLDVGSVRLTERHLREDPPAPVELEAVRAAARRALAAAPALALGERLVGVAGTVTSLAALSLGVAPYDGARVHGARLGRAELERLTRELAALPLAERRRLPALDPKRADVIVGGAVLVEEVVAWAHADELVVSDRGVRWGLARRLAASAGSGAA